MMSKPSQFLTQAIEEKNTGIKTQDGGYDGIHGNAHRSNSFRFCCIFSSKASKV